MKKITLAVLALGFASSSFANVKSDGYILGLVGQKSVDVEDVSYSYNVPTKVYYYSTTNLTGLELLINKNLLSVTWHFGRKDKVKENAQAEQLATNFTQKLLGKNAQAQLLQPIKKGQAISQTKINGISIKNARCGQTSCRYDVVR